MIIRPRTDDDLDALLVLADEVFALDGYPPDVPGMTRRQFLFDYEPVAAWVAELDGAIVGHVAFNERSNEQVMALATEHLGEGFGVLSRFYVGGAARRTGVAQAVFDTCRDEIAQGGLVPILDVNVVYERAIRFYERMGWRRLGTVTITLDDINVTFSEHVYWWSGPASIR